MMHAYSLILSSPVAHCTATTVTPSLPSQQRGANMKRGSLSRGPRLISRSTHGPSIVLRLPTVSESTAVIQRAPSDTSNVVVASPVAVSISSQQHARYSYVLRQRSCYQLIRARLGHPDDNTMCAYCGEREHTALHHEDDFKRRGTAVSNSHPQPYSNTRCSASPASSQRSSRYCDTL